jgi:predicted metal-dependent peptidase
VLDTSGSLSSRTLGRGLGAIASYCASRDVPAVRLVCCDAAAADLGYLLADEIGGRVRLYGRGGTVLQPGIDLLERVGDFPGEAPILVITDGDCEPKLSLRREHAYLLPFGRRLPFPAQGPIFTMPPDQGDW